MVTSMVFEKPPIYSVVDYDGLWKKLINELFEEFVLFFAPDLYEKVDFQKKYEFLQQELYKEVIQEKKGKQIADQIVKVYLKSGIEKWLLIHIEVQGDPDPEFPKRMFRYYYRILDKYDRDIVAIALLTDASGGFRPSRYERSSFGTKLTYEYNVYKFKDQKEEDLIQSSNPFAIAVLAGMYASMSKNDDDTRFRFKLKLMRLLMQKSDFPQEEQRIYLSALIYFVDYILQIPDELPSKLRNEIMIMKEEVDMFFLDRKNLPPTFGEIREEAREEGLEQGRKQIALEMLADGMDVEVVAKYVKLPIEEIKRLKKRGRSQ
ncbi:hypothetical protein HV454_06985 [Bacillus sporothermodurans]|uniref:hypothetical protein n=1 Tax=Heyndrickxia sporothermodurans TaxID=46224 RepID=UPI00192BE85B|nr:hypothetical protein [Heyndrickxia sporothermodurans]MBL5876753.1 hypothetical protein [Heyndrickxia sporothermodurans]